MTPIKDVTLELDAALSTTPTSEQRVRASVALRTWVRSRVAIDDADPRMRQLVRDLDDLTASFTVRLDPVKGLIVDGHDRRVILTLARGTLWFRGGDWQNVVLGAVCSETPHHP